MAKRCLCCGVFYLSIIIIRHRTGGEIPHFVIINLLVVVTPTLPCLFLCTAAGSDRKTQTCVLESFCEMNSVFSVQLLRVFIMLRAEFSVTECSLLTRKEEERGRKRGEERGVKGEEGQWKASSRISESGMLPMPGTHIHTHTHCPPLSLKESIILCTLQGGPHPPGISPPTLIQ